MIAFGFAAVSVLAGSLFLRDQAFAHGVEADSRAVAVSAAANSPANTELGLTVGLTLNGDGTTCGSATSLVAQLGDTIDFCYTVTNHSATALAYSTLEDSVDGVVFESQPTPIPIGGTYVYHRRIVATQSQTYTATWRAQDRLEGYQFDDQATTPFVDIRSTGEPVPMDSERNFASIELPFPFTLYEITARRLCISSYGALFLDVEECGIPIYSVSLPFDFLTQNGIAGPAILPQWVFLQAGERGVYWEVRGEVGRRELIVQWNLPRFYDEPTPLASNFEAILRENGTLSFVYDSLTYGASTELDNAANATIGVQSAAGANQIANQYSYRTPLPRLPPMAIDLTLVTTPIQLTAQASVSAAIVTARMNVTPKTIARSVPSGSSTAVAADVTIANQGDGDLHWFVGEAPNARAHFPRSARNDLTPIRADHAKRSSGVADRSAPPTLRTTADSVSTLPPLRAYAFRGFPWRTDYVWLNLNEPATVHAIADFAPADINARGGAFADRDVGKQYFVDFVSNELKTISTASGETISLGTITGNDGATFTDLTQDPSDGTLYASARSNSLMADYLYKLDPNTLVSTLVGQFQPPPGPEYSGEILAIAFSPEGLMYGIDAVQGAMPYLVAVDKTTAEYTGIGPLGGSQQALEFSMDFDARTGVLHLLRGEGTAPPTRKTDIGTIDRTSGVYTVSGQASRMVLADLAIDSTGCTQPSDVPWLSMTPGSGSVAVGDAPATIALTFDPSGLADGLYRASVCLNSNDPRQRTVAVEIEFAVGIVPATASVSPTMLSVDVPANQSTTRSLTIGNEGALGSLLDYEVTEASDSCGSPSSVGWLGAAPVSGSGIAPEASATVEAMFDSAGLAVGTYTARLCVSTNDPANPTIEIPVVMNVHGDRIFQDGFDSIASLSLSQTSDATPIQSNSIYCGTVSASAEAHYWRRYVLSEYGLPASIEIESVDVSIELTIGAPELTVTLYTTPNTVAADTIEPLQLVRIGQATAAAPRDASLTNMNIPVAGTVAVTAESDLVVEVSNVDEAGNGQLFVIGSTPAPETHPSFLSAHDCGVTVPTPLSALGRPNMHVIEAVHLR